MATNHFQFCDATYLLINNQSMAGLAQISETETRLRLSLSETKPGLQDSRSAKMVLRPRPRPIPGLETTTLAVMVKAFGLKSSNFLF